MKCTICAHGDVLPATATATLEREVTTVVIKSVPAGVCDNCGEEYFDENTTLRLIVIADDAGDALHIHRDQHFDGPLLRASD